MRPRVYLDHASATPWLPSALATAQQVASQFFGDPTRRHREGRAARDLLEQARAAVASALGGVAERTAFTASGTEAIHLAVRGTMDANRTRPTRILSAAVEHSAVLAAADAAARVGAEHVRVPVDHEGRVDVDALRNELSAGAALVNVQHANHEIGTLQPLADVAALCQEYDALLHVDACQSVGRLPVDLTGLGADLLSLSAAKFGGGRGTGALLWSPRARLVAQLAGDEREQRLRAGLQHLPGIAAMAEALLQWSPSDPDGAAAQEAKRSHVVRRALRRALSERIDDVVVHGPAEDTAPHIVALSALYCDGETLVSELDRAGFAVHSGSSCATTSGEPSHVLVAMDAMTHGHVRVSLGPEVQLDHVDAFVDALSTVVATLRG